VTPGGASSGAAGTKATPANLIHGLSLTSTTDNIVRLSAGTYPLDSALGIRSNVTLEGGFDPVTWVKSNATPTIFHRDTSNTLSGPARLIALYGVGISNFRILDVTIDVDDAVGNGISTYGIYLNSCSNFTLSRCFINLGDASDGYQGAAGIPGMSGGNGTGGESGDEEGDCCQLPGFGGSGSFAGSNPGGDGGPGAERPTFSVDTIAGFCYVNNFSTLDGYAGYAGLGMGGAQGGVGGDGVCELVEYVSNTCAATYAQSVLADLNKSQIIRFPEQSPLNNAMIIIPDTNNDSVFSNKNPTLIIYPNPSNGNLTLELDEAAIGHVQIIDAMGRIVREFDLIDEEIRYTINLLPKGIYMLIVSFQNGVFETEKILVE